MPPLVPPGNGRGYATVEEMHAYFIARDRRESEELAAQSLAAAEVAAQTPASPSVEEFAALFHEKTAGLDDEVPPRAPLGKRGRPTVLTPEVQSQLALLLSLGISRRQAAAHLDLDPSTVSHAAKRDPQFAQLLERAESLAGAHSWLCIAAESRHNWRAAAWLIEHQRKYPPASQRETS
jgi:hypothetical protein